MLEPWLLTYSKDIINLLKWKVLMNIMTILGDLISTYDEKKNVETAF